MRGRGRDCDIGTPQEVWEYLYGTESYGNLPQYKVPNHVGNSWMPCAYSTQADDLRTRLLLGLSDVDPLPTQVDHTGADGKVYYLKTEGKGPRWGYECPFDNCPHYIANGERYFYI